MSKSFINSPSVFNSRQYGFSQMVIDQSHGNLFCTSGQVALDYAENIVGSDVRSQMRQVLINISLLLDAAGGSLSDVMHLRIYFVASESENVDAIGDLLREFFGTENPPATTWIGVTRLARQEFLVEIEAMGTMAN